MPIHYDKKTKEWKIVKPTEEEQHALYEIGKLMVVKGMAGSFTNEMWKEHLATIKLDSMFKA